MSGASTIAGLGSHQSAYATVATGIDEKIFGHWQDTSQGKSDVHQSDTDTDQKLPIYEFWEKYLAREAIRTKERTKRWAKDADGVLTFVSHE